MKRLLFILFVTLLSIHHALAAGIGTWRVYPAYGNISQIEPAGNIIYVVSSNNLFSYNVGDQSIETYDKARNLSDTDIQLIKWCNAARRLIIVYDNTNIDLIDNEGRLYNMSDYYNKTITGDKTINSIYINAHFAYIATGFGIVKLNVRDNEISDSYNLGFKVDYVYTDTDNIYAASSTNGLFAAKLTSNLLDRSNWSRVGDYTKRTEDKTNVFDQTNNCYWTKQDGMLLTSYRTDAEGNKTTIVGGVKPDGPKYGFFHNMKMRNNTLYAAGGLFGVEETNRPGIIQSLDADGNWTVYQENLKPLLGHEYLDQNCLDIDPNNPSRLFACGRTGLYEFNNGQFVAEYTCDNSPLQAAFNNDKNYVIINSIAFDPEGNLWVTNSISPSTSLFELKTNGEWVSHHKNQFMMNETCSMENMISMMFDSRNMLWFVNNYHRKTALACYQPSTDAAAVYERFYNQDGSSIGVNRVRCVSEDRDGKLWVGTDVGPLLLEPSEIGAEEPVFTQVKVPRNDGTNYADYLLSNVDIRCIATDGGNRKWFGTFGNGVYLIDSDNITELQHFTKDNSPLLSNNIESIAINELSGEVFFGTESGLCSYMSDATAVAEEMTKDNVYAYPNPVRPDYTGLITIVGLTYNADVKITTANGVLVAQGRSNGGSFTWDGCDRKGKRVASGIYMVNTATADGGKGTMCKIAIVN